MGDIIARAMASKNNGVVTAKGFATRPFPSTPPYLIWPVSAVTASASSTNGSFVAGNVTDGNYLLDPSGKGWVSGTTNGGVGESVTLTFKRNYNKTIVAIGDSITAGHPLHDPVASTYGAADQPLSCWEAHLGVILGSTYTIINKGIGGNTTTQMVSRFTTDVVNNNPAYCLILGGVNDISGGVANSTIQSNLQSMYNTCFQNGILPIACTLTPWNAGTQAQKNQLDQLNQWIREYARDNMIPLVDYYSAMVDPSNPQNMPSPLVSSDNIHPTPIGYFNMALAIDPAIFSLYQYVRAIYISTQTSGPSAFAHMALPTTLEVDFGSNTWTGIAQPDTNNQGGIQVYTLPIQNVQATSITVKATAVTATVGATTPYYTGFGEIQLLF